MVVFGALNISNSGYFNVLQANSLILENVSISGVYENGIFQNVTINNSNIINTPIGIGGASAAYFTTLNTSQEVNFMGSELNQYVSWDYLTGIFSIGGELKVGWLVRCVLACLRACLVGLLGRSAG